MLKIVSLFLALLLFSCGGRRNANSQYTDKQIASLDLDAAEILKVDTDSAIEINLNPFLIEQVYDFGSLLEEVQLIPLETTDQSLVDGIYKIIVTDSNIFINDQLKGSGIIIFDRNGRFIKRIDNGKGPGELNRLYDIDYDTTKNELVAFQHSHFLFFTERGKFLREERLPLDFYNFVVLPDGYALKTLDGQSNGHLGVLKNFTFLVTDKQFKIRFASLPCKPVKINYGAYQYLHVNEDIEITQSFSDTIYQYIPGTHNLNARYILNYSKKKLPETYLHGQIDEFERAISRNDFYFFLGDYFDAGNHQIFFLKNRHLGYETVIYRDKTTGILRGGTTQQYNQSEIPLIAPPIATYGEYFIAFFQPGGDAKYSFQSEMLSEADKRKIKGLSEYDNPVIVHYKLKHFKN